MVRSAIDDHKKNRKFWCYDKKPAFEIRSSLAQFSIRERFVRVDFSISSVFSNNPEYSRPSSPPTCKTSITNGLKCACMFRVSDYAHSAWESRLLTFPA